MEEASGSESLWLGEEDCFAKKIEEKSSNKKIATPGKWMHLPSTFFYLPSSLCSFIVHRPSE
jgi:hypothetical protein